MNKTNPISAAITLLILVLFALACASTGPRRFQNRDAQPAEPFVSTSPPSAQVSNQNSRATRPVAKSSPKTAQTRPLPSSPQTSAPPLSQVGTSYTPKPRVSSAPSGATAQCNDGSYSYSQNHRGTCSHHGGVAQWLD